MKAFSITCLLVVLLFAAFIQAQNSPQRSENPTNRYPFLRPGLERYLDRLWNVAPEMDRLQRRAYRLPWLNPTDPFDELNERMMGLPKTALGRRNYMDRGVHLPPANASPFHSNQVSSSSGSVHEAWVKQFASGLMPSADVAVDLAIDNSGYVYVTGYSQSVPGGYGYLTIKYDPAGNIVWSVRYDSETPYGDYARALALDKLGNIYVTGSGATGDCITVKYNPSGIKQWAVAYDGPNHDIDWPSDIAVDDSGNVYVTGASIGETGYQRNNDYVTIKYDASGVQKWVAGFANAQGSEDYAVALAVDKQGNVYVTGTTGTVYERETNDYLTVKYSPSGAQLWVAQYNGSGALADEAAALAVGQLGNVYVTGRSAGANSFFDCTTVKYSSSGVEEWVARYNGPANQDDFGNAIAVDVPDNVYVTGASAPLTGVYSFFYDYATIKYGPSGVEEWVARYNGPADRGDEASAIAIDESGNVYVTGRSMGPGGPSNPYDYDYCTIKYNSLGLQEWVERYDRGEECDSGPAAFALDQAGNIYITGSMGCPSTSADYGTVKYSSSGTLFWEARYNGPSNSQDDAVALAFDGSGNVYVTGTSSGWSTSYDFATAKYNSSGVMEWIARYNSPNNAYEIALAQAVDGAGNVYVTGGTEPDPTDYITVKYNSSGIEQWVARYNGPADLPDWPVGIAVDNAGNVYVTGWSGPNIYPGARDYATVKYDSSGVEEWVARYDGPGSPDDWATDIAVDALGYVYVTGTSGWEATTVKYSPSGAQEWVVRHPKGFGRALALDDSGNVYVTGVTWAGISDDYLTIKYSTSGVDKWVVRYDGPGFSGNHCYPSQDEAAAIAVDGSGSVYVTGASSGNGGYAAVKYNATGVKQWIRVYSGPRFGHASPIFRTSRAGKSLRARRRASGGWSSYTADGTTLSLLLFVS